jgi:predicted HicB family RNase H-like nuclease
MQAPKVTLSVRLDPEVAVLLTEEANKRKVRSVNELVGTIISEFISLNTRSKHAEALRF